MCAAPLGESSYISVFGSGSDLVFSSFHVFEMFDFSPSKIRDCAEVRNVARPLHEVQLRRNLHFYLTKHSTLDFYGDFYGEKVCILPRSKLKTEKSSRAPAWTGPPRCRRACTGCTGTDHSVHFPKSDSRNLGDPRRDRHAVEDRLEELVQLATVSVTSPSFAC